MSNKHSCVYHACNHCGKFLIVQYRPMFCQDTWLKCQCIWNIAWNIRINTGVFLCHWQSHFSTAHPQHITCLISQSRGDDLQLVDFSVYIYNNTTVLKTIVSGLFFSSRHKITKFVFSEVGSTARPQKQKKKPQFFHAQGTQIVKEA